MEREATPRLLMKLRIQLYLAVLSFSNTICGLEMFGIQRARQTFHNWVHKADLQPEDGQPPGHIAVDETVIQLNDEQYWLYAAVVPQTNELLYRKLIPTTTRVFAHSSLAELREKHDVDDAVFLVDGSESLHAACHRHGFDFSYEKHGHGTAVERVFKEVKRRAVCFPKRFSNAESETADDWLRLFSFAWTQRI